MENSFATISNIIKNRRTVKTAAMNGKRIPDYQVQSLLELADWAPTHAYTEPWRFRVYSKPSDFCSQHAELYKAHTDPVNFSETVYQNLAHQGDNASHVIIATMERSPLAKIPVSEEMEAVACAIQNIMLGATSLGIASFWSTGGQALKPSMKVFLNLAADDHVVGIIYLGYADELPAGKRLVPLEKKISWFR